ncbi:MAG: anion transporter [Capsulimonadaceae bacterium]|nr:anion transporter [Capsulimonadaceae bacterium]
MGFRAVCIFIVCYAIIVAGEHSPRKLDRPAAGLLGAIAMVALGVLSRHEAVQAIDFSTLAILFGIMIVIHFARISGLLDTLALALLKRSHNTHQFLCVVCAVSGILSALFINDTICLLMTPLLLEATKHARINPEPYLLALATSSNVGSVMTLTGNPQNILVGQASTWTWIGFACRMAPLGLTCLLINYAVIAIVYRKTLAKSIMSVSNLPIEAATPLRKKLALKTLIVLSGLLISFVAGLPLDLSAMVAAGILLVWANSPSEDALAGVDWPLLLFFAGLFVLMKGVVKTQSHWIVTLLPTMAGAGENGHTFSVFCIGAIIGSNIFSNVPFVMVARHFVGLVPNAKLLWLALAMASTFAGNLTILGSVANLIVAQGARQVYPLSFVKFLKVGIPVTILTSAAGGGILWLYHYLAWA